jgi:hypothetical protein
METGIPHLPAANGTSLGQNYPNPFSGATVFPYRIDKAGEVSFRVLDFSGRELKRIHQGMITPGSHELQFNAEQFPGGIYYLQMETGGLTHTRKMIIAR